MPLRDLRPLHLVINLDRAATWPHLQSPKLARIFLISLPDCFFCLEKHWKLGKNKVLSDYLRMCLRALSFQRDFHFYAQKLSGKDLSEFQKFCIVHLTKLLNDSSLFNQRLLRKPLWPKLIKINISCLCSLLYIFISNFTFIQYKTFPHSTRKRQGRIYFNMQRVRGFFFFLVLDLRGPWNFSIQIPRFPEEETKAPLLQEHGIREVVISGTYQALTMDSARTISNSQKSLSSASSERRTK